MSERARDESEANGIGDDEEEEEEEGLKWHMSKDLPHSLSISFAPSPIQ